MPSIKVETLEENESALEPETPEVTQAQLHEEPSQHSKFSRKLVLLVFVLFVLILGGGLAYLYNDRKKLEQKVSQLSQNQQLSEEQETKQLVSEVGKLIELPDESSPTVATVKDVEKIKNQAFFANAQNGDKILIYTKSSKAILYRPSTKKIVEVAPITLGTAPGATGEKTTLPTTKTTNNR